MGEMTVASYFTAVGDTVTGLITGSVNVFTALWASGAPGQVVCSLGIAGIVIGFGMSVFRIGKLRRSR